MILVWLLIRLLAVKFVYVPCRCAKGADTVVDIKWKICETQCGIWIKEIQFIVVEMKRKCLKKLSYITQVTSPTVWPLRAPNHKLRHTPTSLHSPPRSAYPRRIVGCVLRLCEKPRIHIVSTKWLKQRNNKHARCIRTLHRDLKTHAWNSKHSVKNIWKTKVPRNPYISAHAFCGDPRRA